MNFLNKNGMIESSTLDFIVGVIAVIITIFILLKRYNKIKNNPTYISLGADIILSGLICTYSFMISSLISKFITWIIINYIK